MKRTIILFLIFSFCTPQNVVEVSSESIPPELFINCNFIEDSESVNVLIEISVFSNSDKLTNGSLKGAGLANDYYKQLDDMNPNSSFSGEFNFTSDKNGTFSFVVYFDGLKPYRKDCNQEITSITTTTRPTTTTTTTRPTTTTTTTRPTTTTTTTRPTTTTTTTPPFTNYKTYTLRSLKMFQEVGFSGDMVRRFDPSNGTIYLSTNGTEDEGLSNYVKSIPNLFKELDINIDFEYIESNNIYQENEMEVWYSITNYTNDLLFAKKCQKNNAITFYENYSIVNDIIRTNKAQVNVCISGQGFNSKKAWTLQGITMMLGFTQFDSTSEYAGYGGYMQPNYAKNKELWNEDDKQLIQILYDPRVFNGMTKEQFKEIFELP